MPTLLAKRGVNLPADGDGRLPEAAVAQLCQDAVEAAADPAFAVRAGSVAAPRSLGALGYVLQNCETVGDAFAQLQRYWCYLHDRPLFRLVQADRRACLVLHADPIEEALKRQALMEYLISFVLKLSGSLIGGRERGASYLQELRFRFPTPGTTALQGYREVFRDVPMTFGQSETTIVFASELLTQRVLFADPSLRSLFETKLSEQLPGPRTTDSASNRVRALLQKKLPGTLPSVIDIAAELAMSRAGLQRVLQAEGASFSGILDTVRKELACDLLARSRFSIGEIAFMLGYADRASFHHAFRRWTQTTPQAFRAAS